MPEKDVLPICAVLWLSGQDEPNMANIRLRFHALCTGPGFAGLVVPHFAEYLASMAPYLERICALLYGTSVWPRGPYRRPDTLPDYEPFRQILLDAMENILKISDEVSDIVEPAKNFYCPISPDGQWTGGEWSSGDTFPMWPNSFGFLRNQAPSTCAASTPDPLASTTEVNVVVPGDSGAPLGSTSCWRPPATLKTRGLRPNGRYPILPEAERRITSRIYAIMNAFRNVSDKPYYLVFSPTALFRRRRKWLKKRH